MATANEYATWIVNNADKKGTADFNTVAAAYQQAKQEESQTPKEAPDTGFTGAVKSSYYKLKGDTALTLGKLGVMDTGEAEKYSKEQDQRAKDSFAPTKEGWTEAPFQKFKETLGGSLPYMAAPLAAGVAGAVGLPGAAVAGIGAGTLAAFGTGVAQFTGSNLDRQMETGKSLADTSLLQAGATAVPQAAFDILSLRMMPLVRGIFGKAGVKITENVAEEVTKKGLLATAGEYAAVTGKTMGMEGSTEAAQQFLERLQAGLNLTDEEARKEYFENFIGGAVLGGAIAIPGRAIEKLGARKPEAPTASTDTDFPPRPVVPSPDGPAAASVDGAAPPATSERLSREDLIKGVAGEEQVYVDPLKGEYQFVPPKDEAIQTDAGAGDISDGGEPAAKGEDWTNKEWLVEKKAQLEADLLKPDLPSPYRTNIQNKLDRVINTLNAVEKIEARTAAVPENKITLQNIKPGQMVTLYRGENKKNEADGQWWTTDPIKAAKFGNVTQVTLPAEVIGLNAAQGHGGPDEFVFPTEGKRPSDLIKPPPAITPTVVAGTPLGGPLDDLYVYGAANTNAPNDASSIEDQPLFRKLIIKSVDDGLATGKTRSQIFQQIESITKGGLKQQGVDRVHNYLTERGVKEDQAAKTVPANAPGAAPVVTPADMLARAEEAQRKADKEAVKRAEEIRLAGVKAEEEAKAAEDAARVKAEENARAALSATMVKPQGEVLAAQIKAVEEKIALFKTGSRAKVVVGLRNDLKALKAQQASSTIVAPPLAPAIDPDDDAAIEAAAAAQAGVDDGTTPQDGAGTTDLKSATDSTPDGVSGPAPGGASTTKIEPKGVDVDTAATARPNAGAWFTPLTVKGKTSTPGETSAAGKPEAKTREPKEPETVDIDAAGAILDKERPTNYSDKYQSALTYLVDVANRISRIGDKANSEDVQHAQRVLARLTTRANNPVPEADIRTMVFEAKKTRDRFLARTAKKTAVQSAKEEKEQDAKDLNVQYQELLDEKATAVSERKSAIEDGFAPSSKAIDEANRALTKANNAIESIKKIAKETGITLKKDVINAKDIRTGKIKTMRSPERAEGESLGVEKVQSIVDELKAIWESAPEIKVVERIRDLPARIAQRLLDGGWEKTPGLFDPQTQRVYLIADNLVDRAGVYYTTVHEVIGHYGLRQVLGDSYKGVMNNAYFNSAIKQVADKRRAEDPSLSKEESVEEAIAELSEKQYGKNTGIRNVVDKIVLKLREWARKLFGPDVFKGMSDAELRQLVAASGSLIENGKGLAQSTISLETKTIMRSAARLRAGVPPNATAPELFDSFGTNEKYIKPGKIEQIAKAFSTRDTFTNIVRIFQSDRVDLKDHQTGLERSEKAIYGGEDFNDIYNRVTLSAGKAFDLMKRHVGQGMETIDKTILEYVKASGLSMKDALNRLQAYSTAFHEQERRAVKYMLTVPLSNAKTFTLPGVANKISPADYRKKIIAELKEDGPVLTDAQAKTYRAMLDNLAANHADPDGESPNGYTSIDVNDAMNTYGVIGGFNKAHVDTLKNFYNNQEPNKAILEKLFGRGKVGDANYMEGAIKKVQTGTTELERIANYWSPQVDNFVKVYGYEHYVPFKGKPDTDSKVESDITNPRSLTKELVETPNTTEGRISDSDNPVLQTLVDAAKGAMRAGRKDVSQAIKNNIQQGHIIQGVDKDPTKPILVVPFKDRYITDWSLYSKPSNILHYTPEGTIEVYSIASRKLRESIRRTYTVTNPFVDLANQITSGVGQMHTRYNPSFSPLNFVRDTLTNSFTMGAEKGMSKAVGLLDATARSVWDNGLWKAGKVSYLYAIGDMAALDKMASDPFVKDILDYLQEGGRVSHIQGLAAKGAFDELMKNVSRDKLVISKEKFDNYVDVWSNAFELTARVSAYRVMKSDLLAKGTPAAEAQRLAVAYSKNLANFEQVGEWGKGAGAFFMFFRPAATGAVRALDALMPAWESVDSLIARLPESVRKDTTKNAEGLTPVEVYRKNHAELKKNARVMASALLGVGVTIYMMALMMSGGDELDRNKVATDDMARWTRYARLPIPGTDTFIQVPWGYGLGSFAAAGAQLASVGFGKNTMSNAVANVANIGLDSFLPLPVSRMSPIDNFLGWAIDSSLPSVARPFVEYVMNVDSLGRKIYNDRLSRYGDSYAGGDNIPTIYKKTAMLLMDATNGGLDISPNTLYFFANNYLDGMARVVQNTAETGMFLAGSTEFNPKSNLITTAFDSFIGNKSNYDAREFSAIETKIKEKERILKTFKESNPSKYAEYLSAHPLDAAIVEIYNKQVGGALQKSREMSNIIRRMPDMSEKDKKEILRNLTLTQNMLKRGMIDTFKAYDLTP